MSTQHLDITAHIKEQVDRCDYTAVDNALKQLDPMSLGTVSLLTVLDICSRIKQFLPSWDKLYLEVRQYLIRIGLDAPFMLRGL